MKYNAKDLQKLIADKSESDNDFDGYSDVYNYMMSEEVDVELEGTLNLEFVEKYGGYEGAGEDMWLVFGVGDQYFKVEGYWDSWGGGDGLDGELTEVFPKEVTRTEFVTEEEL